MFACIIAGVHLWMIKDKVIVHFIIGFLFNRDPVCGKREELHTGGPD